MTENQWAAYKTAKSSRPAWETALIVAAVLAVAGLLMALMSGLSVGAWFFAGAVVALLVAGIAALTRRGA